MRNYGTVSSSALLHNLSLVHQKAPQARIMCVVKANAYGHGLTRISKLLEEKTNAFAVATVEEACELRASGIKCPICLLSGFFSSRQIAYLLEYRIEPVLFCNDQLDMLNAEAQLDGLQVWVKINTGMNRLGFRPEQIPEIVVRLNAIGIGMKSIRFISHFACADEPDPDKTLRQLDLFISTTQAYEFERSIANSAGIFAFPDSHFDWVRPGIMLYGVSPFPHISPAKLELKPVMNLYSVIVAVNQIEKGDSVGYGGVWTSPGKCSIGMVAIGYGDGYPRNVPTGTAVMINGRRARTVGRVSMDTMAVDLSEHPEVQVGTRVTLFGDGLPADEIALATGTIPYEILTSVNPRSVPMEIID